MKENIIIVTSNLAAVRLRENRYNTNDRALIVSNIKALLYMVKHGMLKQCWLHVGQPYAVTTSNQHSFNVACLLDFEGMVVRHVEMT